MQSSNAANVTGEGFLGTHMQFSHPIVEVPVGIEVTTGFMTIGVSGGSGMGSKGFTLNISVKTLYPVIELLTTKAMLAPAINAITKNAQN
jgi:hypothetical protein